MSDFLLVDGNNIVARCHAARAFRATEEPPPREIATTALRMIEKQVVAMHLDYRRVLVAFDGGDSYRTALFAGYKAGRPSRPDGLVSALELVEDDCQRRGWDTYLEEGWEADDVLGTLAKNLLVTENAVAVYSTDKDLFQLIGPRCMVVQPLKEGHVREWHNAAFDLEYGFPPALWPDYKALIGDTSDRLPGVPGCGKVWGQRLTVGYGGLERMYADLKALPPRVRSKLQEAIVAAEEQVYLNRTLATLQEVPGL